MRALRALREADRVPGAQLPLPLRRPQGRCALEDDQPLLVAELVVVRADALPGRQLVDREAELLGAERRADPLVARVVADGVSLVVRELDAVEIDAVSIDTVQVDVQVSPSQ
jgi:hypothetical protein